MVPAAVTVGTPATANGIDPDPCSSAFSEGSGTDSDPYLISTPQDLNDLNTCDEFWGDSFLQTANIDMDGVTWTATTGTASDPFSGTYDGGDFTIASFVFPLKKKVRDVGLFGYVTGEIRNVQLDSSSRINGERNVGGLVGQLNGSSAVVRNSRSEATVNGDGSVGGLVGDINDGTVHYSYATGNVRGTGTYVGGLVGRNSGGTISASYATGDVTKDTGEGGTSGGLVGLHGDGGTLINCYATGTITHKESGGLVGTNLEGTITNCYATGSVNGDTEGGLVAVNTGSVTNSFWDVDTSDQATSAGGTGKTTAELKTLNTFANAGWSITSSCDAPTIWGLCSTTNDGYPYLTFRTGSPAAGSNGQSQTESLTLDNDSGVACASSTVTGSRGQWVTMPGLDDCTVAGQADARVLGWATRANFPVDIARRQVDNGWGAYEWINDEGKVFGVFIPAGGATFLSNSNRLYPIIDVPDVAASQDATDASDVTSPEAPAA